MGQCFRRLGRVYGCGAPGGVRLRSPLPAPHADARPQPDLESDGGDALLPKLFRRLSAYIANRKAGMVTESLKSNLRAKCGTDSVHRTAEYLAHWPVAVPVAFLDTLVEGGCFTA